MRIGHKHFRKNVTPDLILRLIGPVREIEMATGSFLVQWNKQRYQITLPPEQTTLGNLKEYLAHMTSIDVDGMKLMCAGAVMKDDRAFLSAYRVKHGSKILLMGHVKDTKAAEGGSGNSLMMKLKEIESRIQPQLPALLDFEHWARSKTYFDHNPQAADIVGEVLKDIGCADTELQCNGASMPETTGKLEQKYRECNEGLLRIILELDALDGEFDTQTRELRKLIIHNVQKLLTHLDKLLAFLKQGYK
jgi:hypothetical protein